MKLLFVIDIIARIISGIVVIGFFLGLFLREKHTFFEKLYIASGVVAMLVGVAKLLIYAIFGGEL